MARSSNYYDSYIKNKQMPSQQQTDSFNTQIQVAEPQPQPTLQETAAAAQQEASRSVYSRMPYEIQNQLFEMPPEEEWNKMTMVGQSQFITGKALPKFAWNFMKGLPKAIVAAPFKAAYSILEAETSIADKIFGMTEPSLPESINLPWIGEVRGMKKSFKEGKELGLPNFFAGLKAGGEFAGDLAIMYSTIDAAISFTKPSLKVVEKGAVLPTPKKPTAVTKVKTAGGEDMLTDATGRILIDPKNTKVAYGRMSPEFASQYKGNSGNTFVRMRPRGKGQVQIDIVQLRDSMTSRVWDFFSKKSGKSKVVNGPMGPELMLESTVVDYNPNLVPKKSPVSSTMAPAQAVALSKGAAIGMKPVADIIKPITPKVTLNIGMQVFGGENLTEAEIRSTVESFENAKILKSSIHQSDTELTDVIELSREFSAKEMDELSAKLRQQAIPQHIEGKGGELYGPKAAEWGPFNEEFFIDSSGKRLSELKKEKTIKELEQTIQPKIEDPFDVPMAPGKGEVPSIMASPLKGFADKAVTGKQVDQIINLAKEKNLNDTMIQAIAKTFTGKSNIYDLNQTEAYNVSETIRGFTKAGEELAQSDWQYIARSYTDPARYWMEAAERKFSQPIYSGVFLPMETGTRLMRVYSDRWMNESRSIFGKYADPKYFEERRIIQNYIEEKSSRARSDLIRNNPKIAKADKIELIKIAEWLRETYKELFKETGITSDKYFGFYAPKIRESGGIFNLYKTEEMPADLKPFFRFEREGMLSPIEDDSLAVFDIWTRAFSKEKFLKIPVEEAKKIIEKLPPNMQNIRTGSNDYLQEKLGFQDKWSEMLNGFGEAVSAKSNGLLPKDVAKQAIDLAMTNTYAGALGLPRIMPIFRNAIQPFLLTYPEVGAKWFAKGIRWTMTKDARKEFMESGFEVKMGVPYGAELITESRQGLIGKALEKWKAFNRAALAPYGTIDFASRFITYGAVRQRFQENWEMLKNGKINYQQFEKEIDLAGYNNTLQNILREKFKTGTKESLKEAQDLMIMDVLDKTQFPYRKGSESRLHYGLKGKLGLQFSQWGWEYAYTLKGWINKGEWDKLIRWLAMGEYIKRTASDMAGIDTRKWVGLGPFTVPISPIVRISTLAIGAMESGLSNYTEELNNNHKEIVRSLGIFGGAPTGVGIQRWKKFNNSIKKYEAGSRPIDSTPDRQFALWSATNREVRAVSFGELLLYLYGFQDIHGSKEIEGINTLTFATGQRAAYVDQAMGYYLDGEYEKFDKLVKEQMLDVDWGKGLESRETSLFQRKWERLAPSLKEKYAPLYQSLKKFDED